MTDNFKLIKEFIQSQWAEYDRQFDSLFDAFYTIEIIGRAKDNSHVQSHKFKSYYIKNIKDFDKYENEIKLLCDILQMRAYISVNAKSWRKVTLNTMAEYADRIAQDNFTKPHSIFESCAAKFVYRATQLWIVDVDKEDATANNMSVDDLTLHYGTIIEKECKPKEKIVTVIPTKSGRHIITHPFDIIEFMCRALHNKPINDFVKKNGLTLLYENIKND